jgi:hypothetical protein
MASLKAEKIGDQLVLVPDDECLRMLQLETGDHLEITVSDDSRLMMTVAHDQEVKRQVEIGLSFFQRYRKTFEQLARS